MTLPDLVIGVFLVALVVVLAVHGYVMSDGRVWVAIVQPVAVVALTTLAYWAVTRSTSPS